jgi:hypothetical protein
MAERVAGQRHLVHQASVKRLIAAHPEEWERIRMEEWERIRPGQPPRRNSGKRLDLPMGRIVKEYVAGASLRELARKYGTGKTTLQERIPKELLRPTGRAKRDVSRAPKRFTET